MDDICHVRETIKLIIGLTGDSKLSLFWSFRLGFLHGLFNSCPSGLATSIFSLSSLEPKSLRMVILTIILVQVLCCLYQSPKHYIKILHERPFLLQRPSDLVWSGNDTLCGEGDPSWWEAPIVKMVLLVMLRERWWRWPCVGDLGSLSLCLPEALVANAR